MVNLTPFQIHLLLGLSDCNGDGMIYYQEFARTCKSYIESTFKLEDLVYKSKIQGRLLKEQPKGVTHPVAKYLDPHELFRTFKRYDRNANGTLSFSEYSQCLSECPGLNLTK
tara:strand:+ start:1248 stop:1583 length:336 start_codon:yes stop_codon:yes gene_type:complete